MKPYDFLELSRYDIMNSVWQNTETEISAWWLLKYAIVCGDWVDFSKKDIDEFSKQDFWFNRLAPDYIIYNEETKLYSFTQLFIDEINRLFLDAEFNERKGIWSAKKPVFKRNCIILGYTEEYGGYEMFVVAEALNEQRSKQYFIFDMDGDMVCAADEFEADLYMMLPLAKPIEHFLKT